jgi:hypothetical protein
MGTKKKDMKICTSQNDIYVMQNPGIQYCCIIYTKDDLMLILKYYKSFSKTIKVNQRFSISFETRT